MYSNLMLYVPNRKPPMGARRNPYLPINRGLVLDSMMWEGAGDTLEDLSGNGKTGTFQGTAPSWTPGKFGSAVLLPGTNEYISMTGIDVVVPLSISAWVKLNVNNVAQGIFDLGNGVAAGGGCYHFLLNINSSGKARAQAWQGSNPKTAVGSTVLSTGIWYYLEAVFVSNTERRIYVNGTQDGINTLTENVATGKTIWRIGDRNFGGEEQFFNGVIDNVKVYNRALSAAAEIASLYREPFCGFRWPNIIELAAWVSTGENFVRTISDTVGLIDTESLIKEIYRTFDESMGVVDAESKIWDSIRIVVESLGIADTFSKEEAKIISESLGITDVASKVSIVLRTLVESLGLTDAIALQRFMAVDDTLGIADNIALQRVVLIADTLGIADDVARLVNYLRTKTDDMGLLDSMVRVSLVLRTIDDDVGITDEASAQLGALLKAVWAFVIMRQTHS